MNHASVRRAYLGAVMLSAAPLGAAAKHLSAAEHCVDARRAFSRLRA